MTGREAAAAYGAVISLLPEAVLLVTPDGEICSANAAAARILSRTPAALAGCQLAELISHDREALAAFLRASARTNRPVPAGFTLSTPEGRRVSYRCEGAVLAPRSANAAAVLLLRCLPKDAAVNRFVALNLRIEELNREIGRRQRAETALREQRELLQVTLASIGDAVIATDTAGGVTFMNPVAEALTGWKDSEAAGRPLEEVFVIINETTRAAVDNPVALVLREGKVVGLANHTLLVARDGAERPIDDSAAPIRDAGGRILGAVLVFRDVTERRSLERERAEADRRKDEFIAMLGHELRNPLAVLGNGIQVLRLAQAGRSAGGVEAALAGTGDAMERQVHQLTRLVDDLLDVSRVTTGKISLRKAPMPLEAAIQNAVETFRPAIAARGIDLTLSLEPLLVEADAARLSQVFGNLLSNAVKFSEPGGTIRLSSAEEAGCAVVRVRDSGPGIEPGMLRAVFDLFTQADNSLGRQQGGLGVGLTVARRIAELHGGSIEAQSKGLGWGSEFIVRLPLAERSAQAQAGAAAAVPGRGEGAGRRILVVDDNQDAAASLALLLELSGHQVQTAYDGQAALHLATARPPQVILLDVGMPGMDGYEVVRRLRGHAATQDTLIIAVTGYGADADRRQAEAAGFDHHLTKPVSVEAVERLMATRPADDRTR